MGQLRIIRVLLIPSPLSAAVCTLFALAILSIAGLAAVNQHHLFYDYLYGRYGIVTTLQHTPSYHWPSPIASLVNQPVTYHVLIFFVWAIIGLIVYVVVEGFHSMVTGATTTWRDMHFAHAFVRSVEVEVGVRLSLRIINLLLWVGYTYLFVSILVPFCILLDGVGLDNVSFVSWGGALYLVSSFVLLLICTHLHVIFARLVALRPRLFSYNDKVLAEIFGIE